jgi:ATP-dependent DNA ligase
MGQTMERGSRVRCFTRNGHDWADRFPAIVDTAQRIKSFLIDGEAVIISDDGTPRLPCAVEQTSGP